MTKKKFIPHYIATKHPKTGRIVKVINPLLYRAWSRNHFEDKDTLVAVCGETGSRKSGSAITLSMLLDVIQRVNGTVPNLNQFYSPLMERNEATRFVPHAFPHDNSPYWTRFSKYKIFYLATDIIKIISSRPPLPTGTALIWDEVGVEADARDFMTLKNKLINHVFRTVRQFNFYFFITTPTLKDFDVGFKRNLKAYIEMSDSYVNSRRALAKWMWVQVNPRWGTAYIKKMRFTENGYPGRIDRVFIPRPPDWIEKPYKKWKEQAAQVLYRQMDNQIQYAEEFLKIKGREERLQRKQWHDYLGEATDVLKELLDPRTNRVSQVIIEEHFKDMKEWQAKKLTASLNLKLLKGEIQLPDGGK